MRIRDPFAGCLMTLGIGALLALPAGAQRPQNDRPPKPGQQQERRAERQTERQPQRAPQVSPPNARSDRPRGEAPAVFPQRNAPGQDTRPPRNYEIPRRATPQLRERLNNMPPEARDRFLRNDEKFRSLPPDQQDKIRRRFQSWDRLPPEQKEQLREREQILRELTPEQRQYLRTGVLPKWKAMPPDRRQAIQQRLRVLQNMPEGARNRRLADPNFTRGMSPEDRALLHDLSHMHVGAPDAPGE